MINQIKVEIYKESASEDVKRLLESEEALINKYGWHDRKFKSSGVYVDVSKVLEEMREFGNWGSYQKGIAVKLGNQLAVALNEWEKEVA